MFVNDGIAYAGEPVEGIRVVSAKVVGRLSMLVTFSTGEERVFDASALLEMPAFSPLADEPVFSAFSIEHGVVCWEGGEIDVAPERMYEMSFAYERTA